MKMKTLKELQPLIINWVMYKNLLNTEDTSKQRLKLIEECGELSKAILNNDVKKQKESIGDIFVILVMMANQKKATLHTDFKEMSSSTYLEYFELFLHIQIVDRLLFSVGYLLDIANKLNLNLTQCANITYNKIKDLN